MLIFDKFLGVNRMAESRQLPDGACVASTNQRPGRPDLRPWNQWGAAVPMTEFTPGNEFRPWAWTPMPAGTKSAEFFGPLGAWLASDADDISVVSINNYQGSVSLGVTMSMEVFYTRTYDSNPTSTGLWKARISRGPYDPWVDMAPVEATKASAGIPVPTNQYTAAQVGMTNSLPYSWPVGETVAFSATFVTDIGQESAMSEPISFNGGGLTETHFTVDLTISAAAPPAGHNINKIRIYCTKTGASGDADFFKVGDFTYPGAGTVVLRVYKTDRPGPVAETSEWIGPPDKAHHGLAIWSGMVSLLTDTGIWFSPPNVPYAYPSRYNIEFQEGDTPVAQAYWQQSLVVATTRHPYLIQGQDPGSMSEIKIETNQPCLSAKSMVDVGHGVVWAGPGGLVYVGDKGVDVLTKGLIPPEKWQEYYPHTMVCAVQGAFLFAFYFNGAAWKGFCINTLEPTGLFELPAGFPFATRVRENDLMYVLDTDGGIKVWDNQAMPKLTATVKSKDYREATPTIYSAFEVVGHGPAAVKLVADGQTVTDRTCQPGRYYRIKATSAEEWSAEISTAADIQLIRLGNLNSNGELV